MIAEPYRALIVDDEQLVRSLTVRAMRREQFVCDEAGDGDQAIAMCQREHYDLVVTDLRMPGRHGYQLACDLLDRDDHPVITVLTGVLEPRLAKDLYARGVDHIEFKPVDYDLFATKIKSLMARQVPAATPRDTRRQDETNVNREPGASSGQAIAITIGEVEARLTRLAGIMPMSQAALDVVDVVNTDGSDATQIAAAVARDASLAVEILKRANSCFYNPAGEKVDSLEQAVVRIGTRRVGELALATTVLTSLTTGILPWMDVDLAWRRSIAAGLAVDSLVDAANLGDHHEGLFLCALMHGLGRVTLGTLFPEQYQSMVDQCRVNKVPLLQLEQEVLPESPLETMIRLLSIWNVPTATCEPLEHLSEEYGALSFLDEVSRRRVELLKLSVLVGQIAVGQWEPWDLVELPPANVIECLNAGSMAEIVEQTKADLFQVVNFRKHPTTQGEGDSKSNNSRSPRLLYCKSHGDHFDFLAEILRCMDVVPVPPDAAKLDSDEPILINQLGVPADELAALTKPDRRGAGKQLIVSDVGSPDRHHPLANVIALPCSFAALQAKLQELVEVVHHEDCQRAQ